MEGLPCELWVGDFDNYIAEVMDEESGLYQFAPQAVLIMPSEQRCRYPGKLTDSRRTCSRPKRGRAVDSLLELAASSTTRSRAKS